MKIKIELWLGWIGSVLTVIFLGGYTLTINQLSINDFNRLFTPIFASVMDTMSLEESLTLFKSLGAWFGFTTLLVLVLVLIASLLVTARNHRKKAGIVYVMTGICCLIGSQLIAFPLAFFFFIAGGLCFFRTPPRKAADATT